MPTSGGEQQTIDLPSLIESLEQRESGYSEISIKHLIGFFKLIACKLSTGSDDIDDSLRARTTQALFSLRRQVIIALRNQKIEEGKEEGATGNHEVADSDEELLDSAGIVLKIGTSVTDVLMDFDFKRFNRLEQFIDYITNDAGVWTEDKMYAFLNKVDTVDLRGEDTQGDAKKKIMSALLRKPGVRGCPWSYQSLRKFGFILSQIKGDARIHLRSLFLSLPKIQEIAEIARTGLVWKKIGTVTTITPRK